MTSPSSSHRILWFTVILALLQTSPALRIALQATPTSTGYSNYLASNPDCLTYQALTADGQQLWIANDDDDHCLVSSSSASTHLTTQSVPTCRDSILFSLAPSRIDASRIFQTGQDYVDDGAWEDDLQTFLTQLNEEEAQNDIEPHDGEQMHLDHLSSGQLPLGSFDPLGHPAKIPLPLDSRSSKDMWRECQARRTFSVPGVNPAVLVSVPLESLKLFSSLLPAHIETVVHTFDNNTRYSSPAISVNRMKACQHPNDELRREISKISYNPRVDYLISSLKIDEVLYDVQVLTGRHPHSSWLTRHSFSEGILRAGQWLKAQFEQIGAQCQVHHYQSGLAPNLICRIPATVVTSQANTTTSRIVLSAHYDSRGTFGVLSAPGADDDAFGCSVLLSIARSIKRYQIGLRRDVYFVAFSGTEQGLWGSQALSKRWAREGVKVGLMLNANMIGYRVPSETMQLGLPLESSYSSYASWLVGNVTNLYVPELLIGHTPVAGSDEQSFGMEGYPATRLFERNGPIANPYYHQSTDDIHHTGYDLTQVITIAKAMYATLLQVVGIIPPSIILR